MEPAMGIAGLPPAALIGLVAMLLGPRRPTGASSPRGFDSPQRAQPRKTPLEGGLVYMEPAMGIEPITAGLQGRCSTIEPLWHAS